MPDGFTVSSSLTRRICLSPVERLPEGPERLITALVDLMSKRRPNKTRTIQGAYDVKLERLPKVLYSYGGEYRSEYDMTQHERCGGGRRIVRKRTTGGNY